MIYAWLVSAWVVDPADNSNAPQAALDFAFAWPARWQDVTGQAAPPPNPNLVVMAVWLESLDAVLAHPDYGPGAVLYDEPNPFSPDGLPDAAEYGQRRAYLARLGMSNAQFRALFGNPGNPLARGAGAANLIAWCKSKRSK